MNCETGAGLLVPEDCRAPILEANKKNNLEKIGDFEAKSRRDMMNQYYEAMGWGEYKTRTEIRKEQAKSKPTTTSHSTTNKSSTSSTSKHSTPKRGMYEIIRDKISTLPNPELFRRRRVLLEEWGRPD
jgi:hypothetical protein